MFQNNDNYHNCHNKLNRIQTKKKKEKKYHSNKTKHEKKIVYRKESVQQFSHTSIAIQHRLWISTHFKPKANY